MTMIIMQSLIGYLPRYTMSQALLVLLISQSMSCLIAVLCLVLATQPPHLANMATNEAESDTQSHTYGVYTPPSTVFDEPYAYAAPQYVAPSPGKRYKIIEKQSGRVITLKNSRLGLCQPYEPCNAEQTWLVVEKNNYLGFYNEARGRYVGHNNHDIHAAVSDHDEWELFTLQHEVNEWYRIASPFWAHTLMTVHVAEDGVSLTRRRHGVTLWKFVET
ncbi:hypothetical protein GGR57DRAFT_452971 [Xylariaceae sp. FL1272]|nr:hypothetical protein GGR57DRAFT_452971 [Xylariaceae sp. FL1272]